MGLFGPSRRERELQQQLQAAQAVAEANARTARAVAAYRSVKAKYDAAQTTEDNKKHWAAADSLSARSANSQMVRRTLRNRSRYEVANNCYARGMLNTIAAYMIGQGPTLQLTYQGQTTNELADEQMRAAAQKVEQLWATWAYARKLSSKLTTAVIAMDQDGEVFGQLRTSRRPNGLTPVKLDLQLLECDWFDDPSPQWQGDDSGVRTDGAGDPLSYAKLKSHPGDNDSLSDLTAEWVRADRVLHLFRRERPGQLRGIPRTTPALPLFALLRRFTLATVTAAETAADFAAIMYGDAPPDTDSPEVVGAWDRVEIERGALLTAPGGSRIAQLKAEHPNATFDEFVRAILREIARCLSIPAVIALGDASNYNYASGRLDLQSFQRQLSVDRGQVLETECLDRLWTAWVDEAVLIEKFLPVEFRRTVSEWEWSWRWTEPEHVDRAKESAGQAQELASLTTTLAREYARRGQDWETELRQRARELTVMRELGLSVAEANPDAEPDADEADNEDQSQATKERSSNGKK